MTNQHPIKRCSTCTLIPLILGLSGLIALYWVAKKNKAEFIQNDLSIKSNYLLSVLKVGSVVVIFDGRDAVLTGEVESSKRAGEIESIIASIDGIRTLNNQLIIKIVGEQSSLQAVASKSKVQSTSKPFNKVEQESSAQVDSPKNELQHDINTLDLSEITFLFGSDEISEQGKAILYNIAQKLKENEEYEILVEGYTDNIGDDGFNIYLSQLRAQSVKNYLISQGISAYRLNAVDYGESIPIASNNTKEGRARNRRIEFQVTRREKL